MSYVPRPHFWCADIQENKERNGSAGDFPIHVESGIFNIKDKVRVAKKEAKQAAPAASSDENVSGTNPITRGTAPKL